MHKETLFKMLALSLKKDWFYKYNRIQHVCLQNVTNNEKISLHATFKQYIYI